MLFLILILSGCMSISLSLPTAMFFWFTWLKAFSGNPHHAQLMA